MPNFLQPLLGFLPLQGNTQGGSEKSSSLYLTGDRIVVSPEVADWIGLDEATSHKERVGD